jgi:hypothetical protein
VGARRKEPSGQHPARTRRSVDSTPRSINRGRAASNKAYLERKNVTATEENKQADLTASSPQEMPDSGPAETTAPAPPLDTLHQEEQTTAAPKADQDEQQPTPPRVSGTPRKTRILPERQTSEPPAPAAQAPGTAEPPDPAAALADLNWMPPAEDQVARFLNDVADIAPPPVREREGTRLPGFVLPSAISPEEARRKKAKAEPFWSQVVATPMEHPAPTSTRPRGGTRKRSRLLRWLGLIGGILILVIVGLAVLLYTHPDLLNKLHL